ncbi:MMPL family transporter [Planctomicrobium sp. SH664]|uniref:MMPL family transporter n=1 Tax=Planctomicrobium sp. SH664 TaxID=3448125 RepID=UPI003F5B592B
MYKKLGEIVSRYPKTWICVWLVVVVTAVKLSPTFQEVWKDGEFSFLPEESSSRQAELLYREAFASAPPTEEEATEGGKSVKQDPLGSNIVIVLERPERKSGINDADRAFISETLIPALHEIQRTTPAGHRDLLKSSFSEIPESEQVIAAVATYDDRRIGPLLVSQDKQATLVVIDLKTEFLNRKNVVVLHRVEDLLKDPEILKQKPLGLAMALSGSATVGRDMLEAEVTSASRTELFTKLLVIVLLLAIYRAPLLVVVPLATVGIALALTQALLRILAGLGWIDIFTGLEVYVTVVVYGAGIDYCLFLIARYKEELDTGITNAEAMMRSIYRVGAALATSAGTSIIGIGMMGFSDFGKFRQAGFAISFGLFVSLCFVLTFTPAFLLILGKWAFWPDVRRDEVAYRAGWVPSASLWSKIRDQRWLDQGWQWTANLLQRRPGFVFLATVLIMMPLAVVGAAFQNDLSYGLLTDLPQNEPSVVGAKVVQKHFAAGVTGPVTMLVHFDREALEKQYDGQDLTQITLASQLSKQISETMSAQKEDLDIVDIRNQIHPLGTTEEAAKYMSSLPLIKRGPTRRIAHQTYTATQGPLAGEVMRLDFVLDRDPFTREAIELLGSVEGAVREAIPLNPDAPEGEQDALRRTARILPMGTTAGIRDLKSVTDRDRIVIDLLVVVSVYLVLVTLLREPEVCGYLIISVVFSYLVTLGATFLVFYLRDPAGFNGIDWKVPIYLFTILIAMGEDYNILLMARVTEEQEKHGLVGGVLTALTKTGGIISSCGIIMAGTFFSLMSGTLLGMVQLGFALGFGVLLDTFVVRPILVPSYLILLYSGRFGRVGRFLGAPAKSESLAA